MIGLDSGCCWPFEARLLQWIGRWVIRVIIRGWARVAHSRILQTFSSSLGRRVLSWSFATLFLAFPMLVTLFGIM